MGVFGFMGFKAEDLDTYVIVVIYILIAVTRNFRPCVWTNEKFGRIHSVSYMINLTVESSQ